MTNESSANADPRRGSAVADTAVPNPIHHPKDTGVHGVGAGDARSGWLKGEPVDQLQQQEEDDIRKAITASLKDQDTTLSSKAPAKESPAGAGVTGDPRANWLPADTAHGGPHNWSKKEPTPAPGNIQDPRHP